MEVLREVLMEVFIEVLMEALIEVLMKVLIDSCSCPTYLLLTDQVSVPKGETLY